MLRKFLNTHITQHEKTSDPCPGGKITKSAETNDIFQLKWCNYNYFHKLKNFYLTKWFRSHPPNTKGHQGAWQNHAHIGAYLVVQTLYYIESLHDTVRTYARTILSRSLVSFLYGAVCRKTTKSTVTFDLSYSKIWNFNLVCVLIFLSLARNLALWYELNKKERDILLYFPIPGFTKGNQHGGREWDDLQNWLDMTSHENPLLLHPEDN